jgi:hypothetical protein
MELRKKLEERILLKRRYRQAVELVELLRQYGLLLRIKCPKCGDEGTLTTLMSQGYTYLVVRHPNKHTHAIPKRHVNEVLCRIEQDLTHIFEQILEIYKKYTNNSDVKLCADREVNLDLNKHSLHEADSHRH